MIIFKIFYTLDKVFSEPGRRNILQLIFFLINKFDLASRGGGRWNLDQ